MYTLRSIRYYHKLKNVQYLIISIGSRSVYGYDKMA